MRWRAAPAATQVRPIEPVLFGISGLRRTMWAMGSVVGVGAGGCAERSPAVESGALVLLVLSVIGDYCMGGVVRLISRRLRLGLPR